MKLFMIIIFNITAITNSYAEDYNLHSSQPYFSCQRFNVEIKYNCSEGEMACEDVDYEGINKNTGARLKLKGRVMFDSHNNDFQGYIFDNGQYSYTLNPDYSKKEITNEIWMLNVFYKDKVVAHDKCLAK